MRNSLAAAAFAASLVSAALVSGGAFAAAQTDTGAIKSISQSTHRLTLADGKVFSLPTTWKATGYKVGDKVKVTYQVQKGQMMASAVTHAS
jgi:hypothetical protein